MALPLLACALISAALAPTTSASVVASGTTVAGTVAGQLVSGDPIPGDWNVTYGAPAVVTMSGPNASGSYTVTAKTPIRVTGSSCYLPAGTLIATFSGSGGSYSGQHGLWWTSNCTFAQWDPMTLTLTGTTLTAVLSGTSERPTFTKIGTAAVHQPDGRIRLGSGAFVGNNVFNTTGAHQTSSTLMLVPTTSPAYLRFTFAISIRNAGSAADRFTVKANGAASPYYSVTYRHGTTNITAAVVAGAYRTPSLAPGATYLITALVTGNPDAIAGSSVTRLVTIKSNADPTKKDAVKFVVKTLAM
jgi:hypothetical protein